MDVTVIIVPRERFSFAERSVRSVLGNTSVPHRLIYVDGASPDHVRRPIEGLSQQHGFEIVRTEHLLSPNEARNLGARAAGDTRHLVFVDNDVVVSPHWLEHLVRCANDTGASIVGPLYLIGKPGKAKVHMAGGEARIEERDGKRVFHERHVHANRPLVKVADDLERHRCELVEFHTMLITREAYDRLGPFDEGLMSLNEHVDVCLRANEAGDAVWFEPDSVITYVPPPPWGKGDRPYYLLRWSEAWNEASQRRFAERWGLPADDYKLGSQLRWANAHRRKILWPVIATVGRPLGRPFAKWLANRLDARLERKHVTRELDRRATTGARAGSVSR